MKLQEYFQRHYESLSHSISTLIGKEVSKESIFADYEAYFTQNWASLLATLSQEEAFIFYCGYKKEGFDLSNTSKMMQEILGTFLESLMQKGLLTVKSSISHVIFSKKIYLFEEIRKWIEDNGGLFEIKAFKDKVLHTKTKATEFAIPNVSIDVVQFFYSYGFMCPQQILLQNYGQLLVDYLKKEDLLKERLVVEHIINEETKEKLVVFNCCYELIPKETAPFVYTVTQSINYQTRIFNDLIRLCFYIHSNGINYTKKNEINRKNLDRMIKEIENEYVLWFLVQFLKEKNYLKEFKEEFYKLDTAAFDLFHEDLSKTYQGLIHSDTLLKRVYSIIMSLGDEKFTIADVLFHLLKKELDLGYSSFCSREIRRKVIRNIEMLHYMGIIVKEFTEEGAVFYNTSSFYNHLLENHVEKNTQKCLSISSSLQVIVYNDLLDAQTSYIINMFMDVENFSEAHVYQISLKSIQRALYFGFDIEIFITILKEKSKQVLTDAMIGTIRNFAETYKEGLISDVTLLNASKIVLDQLQFQSEYAGFIKKRISEEYAIVSNKLKEKLIIGEGNIYIKYKGEELS